MKLVVSVAFVAKLALLCLSIGLSAGLYLANHAG